MTTSIPPSLSMPTLVACSWYVNCFCLSQNLWIFVKLNVVFCTLCFRVRKQVVNIPSFVVRLDSQKHIDFSLNSPYGGGRPGRVKRKNAKKGQDGGGGEEEEDED